MTTVPVPTRRSLEASVAAVASSVDGRRFTFQWSIHDLSVKVGGYASIDGRLGQVHAVEAAWVEGPELLAAVSAEMTDAPNLRIALARGHGVIVDGDGTPFHDLAIARADAATVAEWLERTRPGRASLDVGELSLRPGVRFALDAGGFDRHTFFCGQSGSGKTYALGTILEQLLLQTSLRLVILDPNSDFVRLGEPRDGVDEGVAARYQQAAAGLVVRSVGRGPERLHVRFRDFDPVEQAAVLRLDPIRNRDEYGALVEILEGGLKSPFTSAGELAERLATAEGPEFRALASADAKSRPSPMAGVVDRGSGLAPGSCRSRWAARTRRRPGISRVSRGEGDRGRGSARRTLAPTCGARAGAHRHRRGTQRVPTRAE